MCSAIKIKTFFNHSIVQSTHFYSALIFCQAFCCVLRAKEWMRKYAGSTLRGGKVYINEKCIMKFLIKFQYILQNVKGTFPWCNWGSKEIPSLSPQTLQMPKGATEALCWSAVRGLLLNIQWICTHSTGCLHLGLFTPWLQYSSSLTKHRTICCPLAQTTPSLRRS